MKIAGLFFLLFCAGFGDASNYEDYVYDGEVDGEDQITDEGQTSEVLPEFAVEAQTLNPEEGETVHIDCTSTSDNKHVLLFRMHPKKEPEREVLLFAGDVKIDYKNKRASVKNQVLTITDVQKEDSGTYVCGYQAGAEDVVLTHTLDVYFAPTIRRKQKKNDVTKGQNVELECRVSGNPVPKITWTKMEGNMPSGAAQEEGSSILFEDVDRHVSGIYQCTADNGVGEPASAKREVIVSFKPEIRTENEIIRTGDGDRVELVCLVHSYPDAMVEWYHGNPPMPVAADSFAAVVTDGHRHLLTLEGVSEADFGDYMCTAVNSIGTTSKTIHVTDAPSVPEITSDPHSAEDSSYTVTWTTDSFYPIVQYSLMFRKAKANESTEEPGEWAQVEESLEDDQTGVTRTFQHTITDLDRATDYNAKISVRNTRKGTEEAFFNFSTKKETAGHQSTNGASQTAAVMSLVAVLSLCLVKLH